VGGDSGEVCRGGGGYCEGQTNGGTSTLDMALLR
jgi:hypothetical protein